MKLLSNSKRDLDIEVIIAERLPDVGLGRTLNDRLERAAYTP